MPAIKMPITPNEAPSRGPVAALSVPSPSCASATAPFDFRCDRFAADAQTLARTTGCSLVDCRQELFMAEGDMTLAFELLVAGYEAETVIPVLH